MFDLRYHVASLAAVFLALVIGILVGVGISGSVSKGEKSLEKQRISQLQNQLSGTSTTIGALKQRQRAALEFVNEAYPLVMRNRLKGKRVAVVFVGGIDGKLNSLIDRTLADAGALPPVRVRALHVPVDAAGARPDADGSGPRSRSTPAPTSSRRSAARSRRSSSSAATRRSGTRSRTSSWPSGSAGSSGRRTASSSSARRGRSWARPAQFLRGFYGGLASGGVPAVGVESTKSRPTAIRAFSENGLSSVDDLDRPEGRFALVLLLRGGDRGHYGVKPTASDGVLPPTPQPLVPRG